MATTPALKTRPFDPADRELLRSWLVAAALTPDVPFAANRAWAEQLCEDAKIVCLTAVREDNGSLVGFVRLDLAPDRTAELTVLVAPDQQRVGVGSKLLAAAALAAAQHDVRELIAVVRETNDAALAFFMAMDWTERHAGPPGHRQFVRNMHGVLPGPPLSIRV